MNRISGTFALCFFFILSACGGGSSTTSTCTGSDCVDNIPEDTRSDAADSLDGRSPVDAKDLAEDLPDFSNSETTITEVVDVGPVEGGFGWPCAGPADCDSGYCIDSVMGAVCTVSCVEECPEEGWRCELFSGLGPDSVFVCLPPETALCRPCGTDADCDLVDGETSLCVAYGETGHFCGTQCDPQTEDSCPSGYQCQMAPGVDGQHTVCIADEGDCPCLYGFVGLATECSHSDDSGTCTGSRTCNKIGNAYEWTECSAPYPAPESCNSIDDDCNGVADDGLGETTCGLGICQHTVVACKDGIPGTCDPYDGSTSEKCNGLDDDCDGEMDESWPDKGAPCDGPDPDSCQNGQLACDGGGESLICVNDDVGFVEECNGLDDDCDGFTDEVADLGETTCGFGVCEHTEANCQGGELVECDPMLGAQEGDLPDLDHLDTNCDGVDGDIATSVFVDIVSGAAGNLGTPESPLKSISAGILLATDESKSSVLVSLGVYDESVTLMEGIGIYGGYDHSTGWSRAAENVTQIKGGTKALIAQDLNAATVVQRIHITSEAASVPGASSHAVFVSGGAGLILDSVTVQAGAGAAGQSGSNGTPGLNGSGGSNGSPGCQYGCSDEFFCFDCLGLPICGACGQPYGASGGTSPCDSKGGDGGDGGATDTSGTSGASGQGSAGGTGGPGGTTSHNATPGLPGGDGTDGDNGLGGGNFGMAGASGYVPASGEFGEDGTNGSGGGGGGGGGGKTVVFPSCCNVYGSSGGGGGGGGCHGTAGTGGGGGGGSFGIYVASGGLAISNSTVKTGGGGTGGTAGLGREGGGGGGAGAGGPKGDDDNQGLGAAGAPGGDGGAGGNGGGGGGGPSVGIVCGPGATLNQSDLSFQIGQSGSGGFSNGTPGATGLQAEVRGCP